MRSYKLFGYAPVNAPKGLYAGYVAAANKMTAEVKAASEFKKPWLNIIVTEIPLPGFKIIKADEDGDSGSGETGNT
jgi:hypothetical protein